MLDEQLFFRGFLDGPRDSLSVPWPKDERTKNQQIQRALQ